MNLAVIMLISIFAFSVSEGMNGTSLIVNVRSQNGDVFQEKISASSMEDWVVIEYFHPEKIHVIHLMDFKQGLQVLNVIHVGEEELGQKSHQEMCFVASFRRDDYISSDAMSKLRQKNPWTVRSPEEDRGIEHLDVDLSLDVAAVSSLLSPHIASLCSSAPTTTFASSRDLKSWVKERQDAEGDWAALSDASQQQPALGVVSCGELTIIGTQQPCICQEEVCLMWYPCGLKFCKDRDDSGKSVSYRCGIRTCRKCRVYSFYASSKSICLS